MRQRERRAYERYCNSDKYNLSDCYQSFSQAKAQAWKYCENLMEEKNGKAVKVISHNLNEFTAGFLFEEDGKQMFMYITKSSDVASEIEEV